jgi:hypothetical protein
VEHLGRLSLGKLTTLFTLVGMGGVLLVSGQQMFSPGPLNAQGRRSTALGGVRSHAEIGSNCAACHVAPWSGATMAARCLDCHTEVRAQLDAQGPLHGRLADGGNCRNCHTEHKGTDGSLTNLAMFDHDCAAFQLTGKHQTVRCASCHVGNVYKGTPQNCVSCHAEPQVHRGRFGADCAQCHTTSTWQDAIFAHSFPLHHGKAVHKGGCAICHRTSDFRAYTCYGCHRHDPVKTEEKHLKKGILDVQNCTKCHPTGRKHQRVQAGEESGEICPGNGALPGSVLAQARSLQAPDLERLLIVLGTVSDGSHLFQGEKLSGGSTASRLQRPAVEDPLRVLRLAVGARPR